MTESAKWKSKLLSSSVPMEYAVAKSLVDSGFAVHSDYSYARDDAGVTKDFSVDIHATGYLPFKKNNFKATLELLVECKHRHHGNKWLFFRDPNVSEMSPFTLGHTIRAIDDFSRVFFKPDCTVSFDKNAIFCLKGVEVDASTGAVHDAEIRHGLAQLQYALPRLLSEAISFNTCGHEEDNYPFIICPILLTTSKLYVARDDISIATVERASGIEDIADSAKYITIYTDSTPDFQRHRKLSCFELSELAKRQAIEKIDAFRREQGEYEFQLPSEQCWRLAKSDGNCSEYFSQTIVCSLEHFSELIEEIKKVATRAVGSLKKEKGNK